MSINEQEVVWDETPKITPQEAIQISEEDIVWDEPQQDGLRDWSNPKELKKTAALEQYEDQNKSFFDRVKSGATDTLKAMGSGLQDGLNIITPVGKVDFMGDNYTGDEIRKDFSKDVLGNKEPNDLDIQAYNAINKLAKTQYDMDFDESNNEANLATYEQNLANVVIDQLGFEDLQKDEFGKYYAIKGDQDIELNKDTFKEIISDVYGDKMEIIGAMIGAKKGYDATKNMGKKAQAVGTIASGGLGAFGGNLLDQLDSAIETGEKLNATQRLQEANKAAVLDMAGGAVVGAVMEGVPAAAKYANDINPFTIEKQADRYIKNDLNTNPTTLEDVANTAKGFGGVEDQRLTQLADQQDTQAVLGDNFQTSLDQVNTYLDDMGQLTKNVYEKAGVKETVDDQIGGLGERVAGTVADQVQTLENIYKQNYNTVRSDILEIAGNEVIQTSSKTLDAAKKQLKALAMPQNVKGQQLKTGAPLTEFQKDYDTLVKTVDQRFKMDNPIYDDTGKIIDYEQVDSDGYNLSSLMDVQKEFNEFFYKYNDDFSNSQQKKLKEIKDSLYDDMKNYVNRKFGVNTDAAKQVIKKWEDVNSDYGSWKMDKANFKEFDSILDKTTDITKLTDEMINSNGTIDATHANFLGNLSKHLEKTAPEKLDDLYSGVLTNIINKSSIKAPINGEQRRIIDFEAFKNNYDHLKESKQAFNKIFTQSKKGTEVLSTLEDLRKIADYEDYIQTNLLKRGNSLTEAVKQATEYKQSFLFGVEYFLRRMLVMKLSKNMFRSEAYKTLVNRLAEQKRYSKINGQKALDFTINKSKSKKSGFTKEDKDLLKTLKDQGKQAEDEIFAMQKEALKQAQEEENKQKQEQIMEQFTKDARAYMDQKINDLATKSLPAPKVDQTDIDPIKANAEQKQRIAQIDEQNKAMDIERIAQIEGKIKQSDLDKANEPRTYMDNDNRNKALLNYQKNEELQNIDETIKHLQELSYTDKDVAQSVDKAGAVQGYTDQNGEWVASRQVNSKGRSKVSGVTHEREIMGLSATQAKTALKGYENIKEGKKLTIPQEDAIRAYEKAKADYDKYYTQTQTQTQVEIDMYFDGNEFVPPSQEIILDQDMITQGYKVQDGKLIEPDGNIIDF